MTKLEQLERQRAALDDKRREVGQRLAAEKRKAAAREKQAEREREQTEAVEFLRYCKTHQITDNHTTTIYDYVIRCMKQTAAKNRGNAAEGMQTGREADGTTKTP